MAKYPNSKAAKFLTGPRKLIPKDNGVPGPGTYNDGLTIAKMRRSDTGKFIYADYKNVRTTDFGLYSDRFDRSLSPEQLEKVNWQAIDPTSVQGRKLNELARRSAHKQSKMGPGPGAYQVYSEFGVY